MAVLGSNQRKHEHKTNPPATTSFFYAFSYTFILCDGLTAAKMYGSGEGFVYLLQVTCLLYVQPTTQVNLKYLFAAKVALRSLSGRFEWVVEFDVLLSFVCYLMNVVSIVAVNPKLSGLVWLSHSKSLVNTVWQFHSTKLHTLLKTATTSKALNKLVLLYYCITVLLYVMWCVTVVLVGLQPKSA